MSLIRLSCRTSRSIVSRSVMPASVSAPASTDTQRSSGLPAPPPSSPAPSSIIDAWRNSAVLLPGASSTHTGFIDARRSSSRPLPEASAPAYISAFDSQRSSGLTAPPLSTPTPSTVISAWRNNGVLLPGVSSAHTGFIDARRSSGRHLPKVSAPAYTSAFDTRSRSGPWPPTRGLITGAAVGHLSGPFSWSTTTRGFSSSPQGSTESPKSSNDLPSEHSCSRPEDSTDNSSKQTTETHELSASQKRFLKRNLKHLLRASFRPPTHDPLLDPLQSLKLSHQRSSGLTAPPLSTPTPSTVISAWRNSGVLLPGASSAHTGFIDARRSSGRHLPKASAPAYTSAFDTRSRSGPWPPTRGLITGAAVGHLSGPFSWSTTTRGFSSSPQGSTESPKSSDDLPSENSCSLPEDSTDNSSKQTTETHELSASQKIFLKRNLKHLLRASFRPPTHDPLLDPLQSLKLSQYAKTVEGVTYDECIDETDLFLNFDPLTYAKTIPMMYADLVPGSCSQDLFWAVTDAAKILIRSLLTILVAFHKMGWCFRILNLQSVVITGEGKFKLRVACIELVPWTPEGVDADYSNASEMVQTLFIASCGQEIFAKITPDFTNLFRIMRKGCKYEYLIYTNVALLPLSSWETVYMKLYTEVAKILKKDNAEVYYKVLRQAGKAGWAAMVQNNNILRQFYPFKKYERSLYSNEWENEIDPDVEQLDIIRNSIAHKKDSNAYRDVVFTFMLFALFPEVLSSIQESLFVHGHERLGRLRIEENFNEGKLHLTDFLPKILTDPAPQTEEMLTLEDKIAWLHATAPSSEEYRWCI